MRLIENRFRLEKRFDPHQPRGKDGRWGGGQSSHRQLAHKVNALQSPSARVLQGEVFHRSSQVAGYLVEPRFLTTPIKHRDKEMARLAHGASAWSRRGANVQRTRMLAEKDNEYYAGKMKMSRTEKSLKNLITAVESAPANSPELYRGMVVTPEHLGELKAGSSFNLPMSSFTESQPFSESFARKWGPMIARAHAKREGKAEVGQHPVVMVLEPKANALNISPLVSERQAEWITQGEFTITQVGDDNGLTVVHLKQTSNRISKADDDFWNAKLHPRGGDPENPGRFSRRPRPLALPAAMAEPEYEDEPEVEPEAEAEAPVPEEKPTVWGSVGGGWGSVAQSQAWGSTATTPTTAWGSPEAKAEPEATPTERPQTWGSQAQQPSVQPEQEPELDEHAKPLSPDGRAWYRVVSGTEGVAYRHQLTGDRFGSKEEAMDKAAQLREEAVSSTLARITGPHGQGSVRVTHTDANSQERMHGFVDADTFGEVLRRAADQAQMDSTWSSLDLALEKIPVEWTYADTHELDSNGFTTAAEMLRQQGVDLSDFSFKMLAVSHAHDDPNLTQYAGNGVHLSGNYSAGIHPEGSVPDATGKSIPVIFLEPDKL